MKRLAAALVLLGAAAPAVSAGGGACIEPHRPLVAEEAKVVRVEHTCFAPGAIVVDPRTTVTFRNDGGLEHNLSGPGITLGDLSRGVEREITFESPGLYPFQCTFHPGMAGVVVVRDADPSPAAAAAPEARDGSGSVVPWVAAAGGVVLLGAVAAFARRARGVPLPAR